MITILGILITIAIATAASVWVLKKLNPYLARKFPKSAHNFYETNRLRIDTNKDNKPKIYRGFKVWMLILVLPVSLLSLMTFIPFGSLQNENTLMLFDLSINFALVVVPAGALAIAFTVNISNILFKFVYRFLNSEEDTRALDYVTDNNVELERNYDEKALLKGFSKMSFFVYSAVAYIAFSNVDVLSNTHFYARSIFGNEAYDVHDLDFELYSNNKSIWLRIKLKESNEILLDSNTQEGGLENLNVFIASQ